MARDVGVACALINSSGTGRSSDIRLHQIPPVLLGGWVLLGEQTKYVAVSPQRFMSARSGTSMAPSASDARSARGRADNRGQCGWQRAVLLF